MDARVKSKLLGKLNRLYKGNPEGSIIECLANGKVVGTYEIPVNHFVTLDSKTPQRWFNLLCVFDIKDGDKVELRIKRAQV